MSYELEHVEKECPCPCGKGRIVYGWGTNDWNQIREGMKEIWCEECSSKYKFSKGGLLPIDYPDYKGDEKAHEEIRKLNHIINNYRGLLCFEFWSDELRQSRIQQYLTKSEIQEDKETRHPNNLAMALGFSKDLADKYELADLKEARKQLSECKYSTQLDGIAKEITESYKVRYNSVKVTKVIIPVDMAIRNYPYYKQADKEDEEYIAALCKERKKAEDVYYKDFDAYEKDRKSHLITFELKDKV